MRQRVCRDKDEDVEGGEEGSAGRVHKSEHVAHHVGAQVGPRVVEGRPEQPADGVHLPALEEEEEEGLVADYQESDHQQVLNTRKDVYR